MDASIKHASAASVALSTIGAAWARMLQRAALTRGVGRTRSRHHKPGGVDYSKRTNSERECARRRRQLASGMLKPFGHKTMAERAAMGAANV